MSGPPCPLCAAPAATPFAEHDARRYWRCARCETTFVDPAQLPARADELREYALHRNDPDDAGYRAFLARLTEPLLARLASASRGLDYGCGPGPALAAMLRAEGHQVALYDPLFAADEAVLRATYDFITCTEVAEHFHRPAEEFARLDTLLAPGGWLALMTTFLPDGCNFARWHYRRDPTHVVFYRPPAFHYLAARHGWECEIPRDNVVLMRKPLLPKPEAGDPAWRQ